MCADLRIKRLGVRVPSSARESFPRSITPVRLKFVDDEGRPSAILGANTSRTGGQPRGATPRTWGTDASFGRQGTAIHRCLWMNSSCGQMAVTGGTAWTQCSTQSMRPPMFSASLEPLFTACSSQGTWLGSGSAVFVASHAKRLSASHRIWRNRHGKNVSRGSN